MIEIPLNAIPSQRFSIIIDSVNYVVRVTLSFRTKLWSISFASEGVELLNGIALLGGVSLTYQYTFPIQNMYIIDTEDNTRDPTDENLGTVAKLVILTDEEVSEVNSG